VKWTRASLVYLASYLSITGVAFLVMPHRALDVLQATGTYDDVFVRFLGAFMLAVATLVVQMIRHRLEVLYGTTLVIRAFFLAVIAWLYIDTRDPLFLMIFGVVALGVALTLIGYVVERKARHV
jgi:hypothetical protein